jgi:TonB family protein
MMHGTGCALFWATLSFGLPPAVTPPEVVEAPPAVYPASALEARREGTAITSVTIDATGDVTEASIVESAGEDLDRAALDAVRRWKFRPAMRGERAVASRLRIPIRFVLPEQGKQAVTSTAARTRTSTSASPIVRARTSSTAERTDLSEGTETSSVVSGEHVIDVTIQGQMRARSHGTSDFEIEVATLASVPRKNASELLELAPGILLTNEGGEGHAEQVFLRGFDAREGQDIEFTVDGVPINDAGNLHGNGYADTHFLIPELVLGLRVLEGPFAPQQGNFAVAGSADYELGLDRRGLGAKYTTGSFGTNRLLLTWGPESMSRHTFAGVELYSTDGFGANRAAKRGTAIGQYEGKVGENGAYRVTATAYSTHFESAGVIRQDDFYAGRVPNCSGGDSCFFGTYDNRQGGDSGRYSIAGDYFYHEGSIELHQQLFVFYRSMRLLENFTGFLLDIQTPLQELHDQRGDLLDLEHDGVTIGARGSARYSAELFGMKEEIELGYFARGDFIHDTQYRIQASNGVPYHLDTDLTSTLGDIGLYADGNIHILPWLTLRGGVREDLFTFNVLNGCAVEGGIDTPSKAFPPGDVSCLTQQDRGQYREPVQRNATASNATLPRATVLVGPLEHFTLSGSYGIGVRSVDPIYITQENATAFAEVTAFEVGVTYADTFDLFALNARAVAFRTLVERELVFDVTEGRNTLAGGTTRNGILGAVRAHTSFFDESCNITYVHATIDVDRTLVPYIPNLVVRSDTSIFSDLYELSGRPIRGVAGVGVTYVGRRPLPFNQESDIIFLVDGSATASWRNFEIGFIATNLLDRRYRLGEYNFVSDFHSRPEPTLVPARAFSAGAPRAVFVTLGITLGGDE